ncbi:P protein-like [Drosophila hydei]|uniref:P protein-like n=1 Tax=Drosophila hydei TaxID=7224 RepID=A0A6J1L4W1_DROHY|nr:P protein-like [Drosophila hydei]
MESISSYQARRSYLDGEERELTQQQNRRRQIRRKVFLTLKIIIFLIIWIFFVVIMFIQPEHISNDQTLALEQHTLKVLNLHWQSKSNKVKVTLTGNLDMESTNFPRLATASHKHISVSVRIYNHLLNKTEYESDIWTVYLLKSDLTRTHLGTVRHLFNMKQLEVDTAALYHGDQKSLQITLLNPGRDILAFKMKVNTDPVEMNTGVIAAGVLLSALYIIIIAGLTDPTFAAVVLASTAIGMLCVLDDRPSVQTIVSWIDMHTLMLIFCMMVMVTIITETGIFGYVAVLAYRLSKGRHWLLVGLLCMISVLLSAFLELVTILMIMVPVVIRLCECMSLRTTTVLICVAIFSNIGGTLTPIGDPPNVIIATNTHVMGHGVDFSQFVIHMFPGVALSITAAWLYLYMVLRKTLQTGGAEQTKLKADLKKKREPSMFRITAATNYMETLDLMEAKYTLEDKPLLIKSSIAFIFALALFALHSLPVFSGATLAWTALMAVMLLLILYDTQDLSAVLIRVDWSMLLFFSALFVLIEACTELGLTDWLAEGLILIILSVDPKYQVVTSIVLILWMAALFSFFIESIPIVTMLIKLTIKVALSDRMNIPLLPMIWALSYGVCFAGNGTLFSTTANIAAAGIAKQHGYKITGYEFFKYGFPVTILTITIATIYLLIAHGIFTWH